MTNPTGQGVMSVSHKQQGHARQNTTTRTSDRKNSSGKSK